MDESGFKMEDLGEEAVEDVIKRLKVKRKTNNTEIQYLRNLIQRVNQHQEHYKCLVLLLLSWSNLDENQRS